MDCNSFWNYVISLFTDPTLSGEWIYYFWAIIGLILLILLYNPIKIVITWILGLIKKIITWIKERGKKKK